MVGLGDEKWELQNRLLKKEIHKYINFTINKIFVNNLFYHKESILSHTSTVLNLRVGTAVGIIA